MTPAKILPILRYFADLRTLLFVTLTLLVAAGNWTGLFCNSVSVALGYLLAFIGCIIAHNHMHLTVFTNRIWNSTLQILLTFAIGQPPTGIITAHNERHHKHPETELDFVRTNLVRFRWNALNILLFPFASIAAMYREKPSDLSTWKTKRPRLFRQAILERAVFYPSLLALIIIDFRATALFLILPWITAQFTLVGMNLLQHQDCDHGSDFDHSRNLTGKASNWLLLNNGFHTAHHLRPSLHWSELPAYHHEHIAPQMNPSLNHRSLAGLILTRLRRPPPPHVR